MTRFQRLAAVTLTLTLLLVVVGVVVRATGSGLGCPDWPFCYGQVLPPLGDEKAWIEWIHRGVAAILGLGVVGLAIVAWLDRRDQRALLWPSIAAVALIGFQAWLGRETVRLGNSGESVTAHLAAAMALTGLLAYLCVRSLYPARIVGRGASQRFTLLAAFAAAATFALLLFGSNVTGSNGALVFRDWPLMDGSLVPPLADPVTTMHVLHRWVAAFVWLIVTLVAVVAWRTQRGRGPIVRLAVAAAILLPVQVLVGGLQVLLLVPAWAQTLHLAIGALIWAALASLAAVAYYEARLSRGSGAGLGAGLPGAGLPGAGLPGAGLPGAGEPARARLSDTIRVYVALTKPRIIELLLVTTVPAMVLAARGIPSLPILFWTLVGGALAAGSANAINNYLDRDIDEVMARTRRRPIPAQEVPPERAVAFGIALGALAFGLLAYFVNLLAAFLALVAIAFYVVVYTILLKRSTPQNIVIGGAAGALPPVIGWAAVTGRVEVPALLLFALVFYWTPPHFWALALRIRSDYAAARIPMLPVVRGVPETARQIVLYTLLTVAISLVFFAVARMGLVYLAAAVVLGGGFLAHAVVLWRQAGSDEASLAGSDEASLAGAVRLYRYSITYLAVLFGAIAVDTLLGAPVA